MLQVSTSPKPGIGHHSRVVLNERKAAAKAIKFMELTEILGQFRIERQTRQS
ncbi:hypothetical protein EDB80DRAFT_731813 [Ilyonectria destructans]|nr:hypothetical protein EDB80DRAFT_731813 [Ilyonectria destructans]